MPVPHFFTTASNTLPSAPGDQLAVRGVVQVEDLVEHRLADGVRRDVERADEVVGDLPVVRVRGGRARRDRSHEAERDRLEAVRLRRCAVAADSAVRPCPARDFSSSAKNVSKSRMAPATHSRW